MCEVQSICNYLAAPNGNIEIHDNATGCNSQEEVEEACETVSIIENQLNIKLNAYPNPFTTSATIEYELNHPETVTITFYNQFGKQVDVIEQQQSAGLQHVVWTPELPVGIYYFRLEAGKQLATGKLVLIK